MQLQFDLMSAQKFTSNAQRARILSETWVTDNMYCPRCGHPKLTKTRNNEPAKDFYCQKCSSSYELKSKSSGFASEVPDGAYSVLLNQIERNENSDFMFLQYNMQKLNIENIFVVPKHFFTPDVLKQRKPLSNNAQRSGWVGCNIILNRIPVQGRIYIVDDGNVVPANNVIAIFTKMSFLEDTNIKDRGWTLDILNCVNRLKKKDFKLEEVYQYEKELFELHPDNNNIKAKIRQQLQILRDRGLIQFVGKGKYFLF